MSFRVGLRARPWTARVRGTTVAGRRSVGTDALAIGASEGNGPPRALDPLGEPGAVELAERFAQLLFWHVGILKQFLDGTAGRVLGELRVHLTPLSWLDVQRGGTGPLVHCEILSQALQASASGRLQPYR